MARLTELVAFGAHDQEVIFPGAMRGVTRLTEQAIPVRADLGAGGDEFVRHGPGHPADRVRAELGALGVAWVAGSARDLAVLQRKQTGNLHGLGRGHAGLVAMLLPDPTA